jgi:hypothetical protein
MPIEQVGQHLHAGDSLSTGRNITGATREPYFSGQDPFM